MNEAKIHESVELSPDVVIGEGTSIWQYDTIQDDVRIRKYCAIGAYDFFSMG